MQLAGAGVLLRVAMAVVVTVPRPAAHPPQVAAAVGARLPVVALLRPAAADTVRLPAAADTVRLPAAASAVLRPAASVVLLPAVATARPAASVRLPAWGWFPARRTACTR
jgi:hypothetical protein